MREILFRGKRVDNGEWVYGDLNRYYANKGMFIAETQSTYAMHTISEETIGQYTGLTDKNGTKIFEGDIVKDYYGRVEKCFYNEARKRLMFEGINYTRDFEFASESEYEVIGNIHDNPELLKEREG